MKKVLAAAIVVLAGAWTSSASIITRWTFETSLPSTSGPHVAESGPNASTSMASGLHAVKTTSYSSLVGAGSAKSFSANNWAVGDYYQFTTSTLGYSGVSLGFEAASSSTGPKNFRLAYSTDGTTFTLFTTYSVLGYNVSSNPEWENPMTVANIALYTFGFDLSSVAALNNQSKIYLQLIDNSTTSAKGGSVAGGGTSRVDDFTISANAMVSVVPEPSTFIAGALLGLPLVMQGLRHLRRHQRL